MTKISVKKFIPAVFAVIALPCSVVFTYYCESVQVHEYGNQTLPIAVKLGLYTRRDIIETTNKTSFDGEYVHGECVPLGVDFSTDTYLKTARSCTNIASIAGGLLTAWLFVAPIMTDFGESLCKDMVASTALAIALFQGLGFLIYTSDLCNPSFTGQEPQSVCDWNHGSTANVIAIFFWVLAACFLSTRDESPEGEDEMA